jgi:diaminopropionate ammonia-lyase
MARLIQADAHVFVPAVVGRAAVALIRGEGAEVTVVEDSYDQTVRRAARFAGAERALLVQDTAWPGYEQVPRWIVEGYATLFSELEHQVVAANADPVGLIVVPTGVGSLAQAAVTSVRSSGGVPVALMSVEPESAACVLVSLTSGRLTTVATGATNMAGLNCGTPSSIAWPFLANGLDAAITVSDAESELASRDLGTAGVSAGPCGSASLAALRAALLSDGGDRRRRQLGLTPSSTVVLLNTEGRRPPSPVRAAGTPCPGHR